MRRWSERPLIVDDVITAGTAIREVMQIIQAQGAQAAGVLIALNRQERGQGELSAIQEVERDYGMPVVSIVSLSQVLDLSAEDAELKQYLPAVEAYRPSMESSFFLVFVSFLFFFFFFFFFLFFFFFIGFFFFSRAIKCSTIRGV